jgi:hypothetical protein
MSHDKILPEIKPMNGTIEAAQRKISPRTIILDKGTAITLLSKK